MENSTLEADSPVRGTYTEELSARTAEVLYGFCEKQRSAGLWLVNGLLESGRSIDSSRPEVFALDFKGYFASSDRPCLLRDRVERAIRSHIEDEAWERVELVEEAQRQSLKAVMDGWAGLPIRGLDAE